MIDNPAGRTVFITGGAQGIGLGIARAFAGAGARVALADIDAEALMAARAELAAIAGVATYELDVRDRIGWECAADDAEARLGRVSILCNSAGVGGSYPLSQLAYELWDFVLGINLGGVVNGVQTFLPRMLARKDSAHIINVASGVGLAPAGVSSGILYDASKSAVIGLSEALGKHLQASPDSRIGVTVVCPGPVATNIIDNTLAIQPAQPDAAVSDEQQAERSKWWAQMKSMLDRFGLDPETVGAQVLQGVLNNQLYVHSDRTMLDPIRERTKALLASMPEETDHDRAFRAAIDAMLAAQKSEA